MRILQVITSLSIGGAEKLIAEIVPLLRSKGHEVDVLAFDGKETHFLRMLREQGIRVMSFGENCNVYNPLFIFRLTKLMRKYETIFILNPSFDEETVKAINNQINRYREVLESLKEEESEEQVVRVFNNKLEGKITLENNNLGLYQSCTEDELVEVEANLLSSAKELGIKIRFEHEYNKVQEVVEESKSKRFESFEELRSSVRKGDIITLVETTELLNGEFTVRTYKLRVDRVNKKTVSMTNLTSDFTFKLADITNEFCYSVKREYFYTEEYDEPKEDKIKVVVKKPGDTHGQIVEIENRLEELQSIVEGYIEVFPLTEDILIILNEEGKLQDLKPNIFVSNGEGFELIVGNIVIVADKGEDFGSLNDEQMDQLYDLGILDNRHIEDFLNL